MSRIPTSDPSIDAKLVPVLIAVSKSIRALHGHGLAMHGFHNGQDELLLIADEHGTTVSAVADLLSIRASTVSKMSDRLVQRGLVERVGDADDGRRTMIRITTMGIQAQKELLTVRDQLENDLTKCLDADRKVEIIQSLQELAVLLVARLRRLR